VDRNGLSIGRHSDPAARALLLLGTSLAIAGGVGCLVKGWLIYSGDLSWPGGARSSLGAGIVTLLGLIGLGAGLGTKLNPGRAAQAEALAGVVAIVYDLGGEMIILRIIPGLSLLGGGAVTLAHRRITEPHQAAKELDQWSVWVGLGAHAVVGVLLGAIGLGVPATWVLVVYMIWFSMLALGLWLRQTHPRLLLMIPIASFAMMFAVVSVGSDLFGWMP
jgi:hypothetical protein